MGGFAQQLLSWEWRPPLLTAEVSRARYLIRGDPHEVLAHAEIRELGSRRRCEIGSFADAAAAKAACERHAALLCAREPARKQVDVRIVPVRAAKAPKPKSERAPRRAWGTTPEYEQRRRRREPDYAGLDAALASFAAVLGEE